MKKIPTNKWACRCLPILCALKIATAEISLLVDDFDTPAPGNWTVTDPSNTSASVVFGEHTGTYGSETRTFAAAHETESTYLHAANRLLKQTLSQTADEDLILRFKMLPSTWSRGQGIGLFNSTGTDGYVMRWDSSTSGAWNGEGKITLLKYSSTSEVDWNTMFSGTAISNNFSSGHSLVDTFADAVAGNDVMFADFVLTWEAATGTIELFIDGELITRIEDTDIPSFERIYIRSNERILFDDLNLVMLSDASTGSITKYNVSDLPSVDFSVTINGESLPVRSYKDFDYVHFALNGTSELSVTAKNLTTIGSSDYRIRPLRRNIAGSVSGNELTFTISNPQQLVLNIDDERKLMVFADPPEINAPDINDNHVHNILDYGIDNTNSYINTADIQDVIDNDLADGDVLYFPAGVYRTGSLNLKSNITLYLASGALLMGSNDLNDIDYLASAPSFLYFLAGDNIENLTIRGRGAIDGNGHVIRALADAANGGVKVPGRLLSIRDGENVEVEGIYLRDAYSWNTHIVDTSDFDMSFSKIINDFRHSNGDGIDVDGCQFVNVQDTFIYAEDDAISPKVSWSTAACSYYTFKDCVIWSNHATGIRLGSETHNDMTNFVFKNIDILRASTMIRIFNYHGADISAIDFENVYVEEYVLHLATSVDEYPPRAAASSGTSFLVYLYQPTTMGSTTDILFKNLTTMDYHEGSRMSADAANLIDDITFDYFTVGTTIMENATEADVNILSGTGTVTFVY